MSFAFLRKVKEAFGGCDIFVISKPQFSPLLNFVGRFNIFHFSKDMYKGFKGLFDFSLSIRGNYEYYFSLPDSLSSALMGFLSGAKRRIGYSAEFRDLLLTDVFKKPKGLHRVEEYAYLLKDFLKEPLKDLDTSISVEPDPEIQSLKGLKFAININSEAQSRRMSIEKWARVVNLLIQRLDPYIILTGAEKDAERVKKLIGMIDNDKKVINLSGKTDILGLARVLKAVDITITVDSGPAHLSNSVETPTLVLFGAGNEKNTSPYLKKDLKILRLKNLKCAPCLKNRCKYGEPICLNRLDEEIIVENALSLLQKYP